MTDFMRPAVGVAWYSREHWQRLRDASEDRADLEDTWEEWNAQAEEQLADLRCSSIRVIKVPVDVDAMVDWCRERGVPVNAENRAAYTAELVRMMQR
ncbi:MAG: hypothetical protein WEE89_18825 [Gemmatimonadota bacterium]